MPRRTLLAIFPLLLVAALLNLPVDPTALRFPRYWGVPLELLAVCLLALWAGPARARMASRLLALFLLPLLLLSVLESVVWTHFGRPLLLASDLLLLPVLWDVARDIMPAAITLAALAGALAVIAALYLCSVFPLRVLAECPAGFRRRTGWLLFACGVALVTGQLLFGEALRPYRLANWDGAGRVARQIARTVELRRELVRLRDQLARDAATEPPEKRELAGLRGVDVLLLFVESYGRSALERSPFADRVRPFLAAMQKRLEARHFGMRSAWLRSPTVGGQSWLAHETLLSGLWLDNQAAYRVLFLHRRRTLVDLFRATRHRTVLVMPAISRPWPEARWFGFDRTYFARDLDYRGPRIGWPTMPDAYTLSRFASRELGERHDRPPLFAELVLISSHAPFTPVPATVPWQEIGDGSIFARRPAEGAPAAYVWRDRGRIREAYARAVRYSLDALDRFVEHAVHGCTLLIVLGDHQPAALLTGPDAGREVPVHVIADDPSLLQPFERWGFTPGMLPAPEAAVHRMDEVRDFLRAAYGGPGTRPPSHCDPRRTARREVRNRG